MEATRYVRIGNLPNGNSRDYRENIELAGVSCFELIKVRGEWFLGRGRGTAAFKPGPVYELRGEEVGTGPDGEPLLRRDSIEVVGRMRKHPTAYRSIEEVIFNYGATSIFRNRASGKFSVRASTVPPAYEDKIYDSIACLLADMESDFRASSFALWLRRSLSEAGVAF